MSFGWNPKSIVSSAGVAILCLYSPFAWLLFDDYPWNGYRLFWIRLWPILPGFYGGVPFHGNDAAEFTAMGVLTAIILAGLTWLGTGGKRRLALAAATALLISVPTAFGAHAVFHA